MKNTLTLTIAAASLAFASTTTQSEAVIVWTGATSSDLYEDTNWDFTGSTLTAVDPGVAINDDITISGFTVSGGGGNFTIGDSFTLTLTDSTFTLTGGFGFHGVDGGAQSAVNSINSSIVTQFAVNGIDFTLDGSSSIQFNGGGDPINSQADSTTLDLSTGAQLILPTRAEFDEQVTVGSGAGTITVNGIAATAANMDDLFTFTGTGPVTGTAVPEPSSTALLGLGGLALILRRRK